jgi:hypothetical protein
MAEIKPLDAPREECLLPYATSRTFNLTIKKELLQTGREYLRHVFHAANTLHLTVKAQRLVTHSESKWCWRDVTTQHRAIPLFNPLGQSEYYNSVLQDDALVVEFDLAKSPNQDISLPFAFNALCKDSVINIFRIVIDLAYQQRNIHTVSEHPIFAMSIGDQQDISRNVQYCNEITMDICKDIDPFFYWWWQDFERARQQQPRAIRMLDSVPTADQIQPKIVLQQPTQTTKSDEMEWSGPDPEMQEIAKQISFLPDPQAASRPRSTDFYALHRSSPHVESHRHSAPPGINTSNITMQSLYDMIGSLSPSPATPLTPNERAERPRRRKAPPPISTTNEKIHSPAPRQTTPFLISSMGIDQTEQVNPLSPIPIRPTTDRSRSPWGNDKSVT